MVWITTKIFPPYFEDSLTDTAKFKSGSFLRFDPELSKTVFLSKVQWTTYFNIVTTTQPIEIPLPLLAIFGGVSANLGKLAIKIGNEVVILIG